MGAALVFAGCSKTAEQSANPYRKVVDYKPSTFTVSVPGTLTDVNADWISMTQNGSTASFTTKLNTTGLIRRAEYPIQGGGTLVVSQKSGDLDAVITLALASFGDDFATMNLDITSANLDDYASWGVFYSLKKELSGAKKQAAASMFVSGNNQITISDLEPNTQYYIWGYVESLEGMQVVSDAFGFLKPTVVPAGGDLQAAIDSAPADSEVRVEGGAVFAGGICLKADVTVSGGWNSSFTEQSADNKSIIDGGNAINCVFVGFNPDTKTKTPLESPATITNFEIRNGYADEIVNKGGGFYVCGDVVIDNCYIHDNVSTSRGGALLTAEDVDGTCVIKNCVIKNNMSTGHHAGAICFDGSKNRVAYVINNLMEGNFAKKFTGYCGTLMLYNPGTIYVINNTIIGNKNYDDGPDDPWFTIQTRRDISLFMVNNIVAGNLSALQEDPDNFYRQEFQAKLDCISEEDGVTLRSETVVRNNIIEGGIYGDYYEVPGGDTKNMPLSTDLYKGNNIIPVCGFDLKTIFKNPAGGDYTPVGDALKGDYSDDVAAIMKNYGKDLLGNNRVVDGKINMGCYQVQ